jgi:hypothetical protein
MFCPTLVFVQLGNPLPKYAYHNIRRTAEEFSDLQVFLIVDQKVYNSLDIEKNDSNNLNIYIADLGKNLDSDLDIKKEFRGGFWHYTKKRLDVLGSFHEANPDQSILHIENDVLLLKAFREFPLNSLRNVSWLSHTEEADSGAVLFSPTPSSTRAFVSRFNEAIESDHSSTDMQILHKLRQSFPEEFGLLPTLKPEILLDPDQTSGKSGFQHESGFDPAFLGIWMFGDDPRNRFGISKRYTLLGKGRYILPGLLKIDETSESLIFGKLSKKIYVYSIHVHCKRVGLLNNDWENNLKKELRYIVSGRNRYLFSSKMLKEMLKDYKNRGKLHTLILAIPYLGDSILKIRSTFLR